MSSVLYSVSGKVATITLNRPEKLNAIDRRLVLEFNEALSRAQAEDQARVIRLNAAGRSFCAGDDLDELATDRPSLESAKSFVSALQDITRKLMLGRKPSLCAVQGYVVGGGAAWPLNADFSVWSHDAQMFLPEARHGLYVSGGMSMLLAERAGPERAMQLMLTGERCGASTLAAYRIAETIVRPEELTNAADERIERLLSLSDHTLAAFKAGRAVAIRDRLEAALEHEAKTLLATLETLNLGAIAAARPLEGIPKSGNRYSE